MFNKILIVITLLSVITAGIFAYLYQSEKHLNIDLSINNTVYQRELVFNDSISKIKDITISELEDAYKISETDNANFKWELERIEKELNKVKNELKNMSLDSIAKYIVDNFLGDVYKIEKINDSTFVAFQEITVRDIANGDIAFKALFKRFEALSHNMDSKDTLIEKQAKTVRILTNTNDTLLVRNKQFIENNNKFQIKVIELTTEVDKQKGQKRIGFLTAGGLLLLLIIL